MTGEAVRALDGADVIVGYATYIRLIEDLYPEKEMLSTPMRQERERCQLLESGRRWCAAATRASTGWRL